MHVPPARPARHGPNMIVYCTLGQVGEQTNLEMLYVLSVLEMLWRLGHLLWDWNTTLPLNSMCSAHLVPLRSFCCNWTWQKFAHASVSDPLLEHRFIAWHVLWSGRVVSERRSEPDTSRKGSHIRRHSLDNYWSQNSLCLRNHSCVEWDSLQEWVGIRYKHMSLWAERDNSSINE